MYHFNIFPEHQNLHNKNSRRGMLMTTFTRHITSLIYWSKLAVGFEPTMFFRFQITNLVHSTTMRHQHIYLFILHSISFTIKKSHISLHDSFHYLFNFPNKNLILNACPGTRTPTAITATLVFKTSLLPIRVDRHKNRRAVVYCS